MYSFENISAGFGRARMPVENPFLCACMEIAQRRSALLARAQAENGFILDQAQNVKELDKKRYGGEISAIAALFHKLQHDNALYSHCSGLARQAAAFAKRDPVIAELRADWAQLDNHQRLEGFKALSRMMVDILNDSEESLCLNYPMMALARFPEASRATIAMQVQAFAPPGDKNASLYLMSVNDDMLRNADFNGSASFLWHEHQHVYMSGLRSMLQEGFLPAAHPLYQEAYKSKTIQDYKITGNISLAHDIYYAEPEEKLCYFTQDIFNKVFRYVAEHPALKSFA